VASLASDGLLVAVCGPCLVLFRVVGGFSHWQLNGLIERYLPKNL